MSHSTYLASVARVRRLVALGVVAAITAVMTACTPSPRPEHAARTALPPGFAGGRLVAVSDADMLASAYVDGRLGPERGRDTLSVIPLGAEPVSAATVEVSNSVAGPPSAVTVSPDGRYAFVVETYGPRIDGGETFGELPAGTQLIAVDIGQAEPRVVDSIDIGRRPTSVAMNPDGDMLAVALHPDDGRQIALVPVADGMLGRPNYVGAPGISPDDEAPHVEWHPSGRFLALTVLGRNEVVFFEVEREPAPTLRPYGDPVVVGKYPMMGRFTADGQYFVNVNLSWGEDVEDFWVGAPRGEVTVTAFDASSAGAPTHRVVSRAPTAVSPEGMSISPDGRFVVTANLERSYLPPDDPRITWYSSLTPLQLDSGTGQIRSLGDSRFPGILPEAAVFDASSRFVAAAVYDRFDAHGVPHTTGAIDFWRIAEDPTSHGPTLVSTDVSVPVMRGPHSMVLAPPYP